MLATLILSGWRFLAANRPSFKTILTASNAVVSPHSARDFTGKVGLEIASSPPFDAAGEEMDYEETNVSSRECDADPISTYWESYDAMRLLYPKALG